MIALRGDQKVLSRGFVIVVDSSPKGELRKNSLDFIWTSFVLGTSWELSKKKYSSDCDTRDCII